MAFQTNVFRNGAWVTETIDLQTVLRGSTTNTSAVAPSLPAPPSCGILTRTVIDSPIARWVLPARLRSAHHNDVAFVGDRYVSINELRKDGQLQEVLRKNDFGCRIRNALVIGNKYEHFRVVPDDPGHDHIKSEDEDDDTHMADIGSGSGISSSHGQFPPHLLLLILESGSFVFLFIKRDDERDTLEFVASPFHNPARRLGHLGFHVAVDPRSRYIAVADAQNKFVVYELESMEAMGDQFILDKAIKPIRAHHPRAVQGTILKMEFLYPRPEDESHVILLLIIAKADRSKMVIYEWERGDDLSQVLAEEKRGHRIAPEHRLPLLIIPLTVRSSFFAVSEHALGICKDPLQGPPDIETINPISHPASPFHHGTSVPLWTAWDRPVRRRRYYDTKDLIYLAREDGVIVFFEFNTTDILGAAMNVGSCNCNISTAFTTMYDAYSDVAIVAGDSGPGMVFQLKPREPLVELGSIPNWSCSVDFVTTDALTSWDPETGPKGKPIVPWRDRTLDHLTAPDKVLCASGNGPQGSITELRYGLPANIISYFEPLPTRKVWVFRTADGTWPYQMLMASPGTSDVLLVSFDLSNAEMADPMTTQFDTECRTLAAQQSRNNTIVQVSEKRIVAMDQHHSSRYELGDFEGVGRIAEHAAVRGNCICVSTFEESCFRIHTFHTEGTEISLTQTCPVDGEVTCLAFCSLDGRECVLAGLWRQNSPYLAIFPTDVTGERPELILLTADQVAHDAEEIDAMDIAPTIELVTTIVSVAESAEQTSVVVGTRSGHLITVQFTANPFQHQIFIERLGTVALEVVPLETPLLPGSVLVCCNDSLLLLRDFEARRPGHFATKHRVWATDLKHPATPSTPIISAACIPADLGGNNRAPLVLLSGERMSFVELYLQAGPVPKTLPLPGTPSKVLYSQTLQCLVVAVQIGKKPTVLFLDPETGEDLSLPQDKHGNATTFISGLGSQDDKIHAVYDWLFVKDGMTFHYLIVTTAGGRLLLVSPKKEESHDPEGNKRTRIRFSTKYRIKEKAPIYSIVGDGDSIIYCAGKVLHWDVLDSVEKRLVRKKTYELNSPAISLRMVNGKISALTLSDSLVIIDHKAENTHGEMTQIHADQVTRKSNHFFDVGDDADPELSWPVTLLTGMDRSFTAVWTPWKQPKRELELVAEGPLPASIRKLQRGRVRPEWVATEHVPRYGSIPSTVDGAEVLGICLDGSLMHFSLLNLQAWRFLRLVENLALRSPLLFPYSYEVSVVDNEEYDAEAKDTPKSMKHINGDLLQQCIDKRVLREIMGGDSNHDLLREYLDGLDDGKWTASFQEDNDPHLRRYFDLAYDILDYFLAPVL
ncbi:thermotolerance protein [Colletotrichum scovillei]|uniref:Thermotolerance protein n=1 Tax=Colletotrichum scovillei TaxID=1209932 RepID=A0A9P7UHG6_9PEZI|nr:thermotolerance protein [Colletotrichum scovillei]KAF4773658.1 thermotolerance protein [Colletotrichum scovillei]KAG7048790.1 thermotolerance protein [Colletotrichum scovillei]KAG7065956.1 thermotolerance protein [Colletotrichum scovillei]KAG7068555.1 thermotolerance protein [Colletotrichum scovillei]